MPGYQYHLVGRVREPDRYRFLKVLHSVRPLWDDIVSGNTDYYYRVQLPQIKQTVPLPGDSLCWTSIAYLLWDDIDPSLLNSDQRQALLDWLHWGGQIVISGPKTLDALKNSFLDPYLPATAGDPLKIDDQTLQELNAAWTVHVDKSRPLTATVPWNGVTLNNRRDAVRSPAPAIWSSSGSAVAAEWSPRPFASTSAIC